jgi:hypothetical protein
MRHLMFCDRAIVESRLIEVFNACDRDGNDPMVHQCRNKKFLSNR